jgi:hypothetical protein
VNETFSATDLEPSDADRRAVRRDRIDRVAATLAALAVGLVVGGMLALGACAAPFVFAIVPPPAAGDAMGAAFSRFDQIAITLSVVLLGAEVVRTFLARREPPGTSVRVRRLAGMLFAACTAYMGLFLSPAINDLHRGGARMSVGPEGERLAIIHQRASTVGKVECVLGLLLVGLHVFTIRSRNIADDDEEDAATPGSPGETS